MSYEHDEIHVFGLTMEHKIMLSSTLIDSTGLRSLEYKEKERFDILNHSFFDM